MISENVDPNTISKAVSFGYAIESSSESSMVNSLPDFPCDNLRHLAKIFNSNPNTTAFDLIYRLYPFESFLSKESLGSLQTLFKELKINVPKTWSHEQKITNISHPTLSQTHLDSMEEAVQFTVTINSNGNEFKIQVPGGRKSVETDFGQRFIETNYHNYLLSEVIQSYAVGDVCLIGSRGCGKSMLITQIAKILKQNIEPMILYQDMTARDFVQQRTTTVTGDTIWRDSPMIRAAKNGSIAILDGIHRIHSSTISILHRLVHDREVQLYDGARLIAAEKYDALVADGNDRDQLTENGIFRIHPAFRIVALAEPPSGKIFIY